MTFTIRRKGWLRGEVYSCLVRYEDKKMCCLGFFGRACKIPRKDMMGIRCPAHMGNRSKWPEWVWPRKRAAYEPGHSADIQQLVRINDSTTTTDAYKERHIRKIFAKHGVRVEFKD